MKLNCRSEAKQPVRGGKEIGCGPCPDVDAIWQVLFGILVLSATLAVNRSLEIVAGSGHYSEAQAAFKWETHKHDYATGVDIIWELYLPTVLEAVKARLFKCIVVATECTTFCRANTVYPLRTNDSPMGLPSLTPRQRRRCRQGNQLLKISITIFIAAVEAGALVFLENPLPSMLWTNPLTKALWKLVDAGAVREIVTCYCAWGAPWQKATRILTNLPQDKCDSLSRPCCGRRRHEESLQGWMKTEDGKVIAKTKLGNSYPRPLCVAWAGAVHAHWQ